MIDQTVSRVRIIWRRNGWRMQIGRRYVRAATGICIMILQPRSRGAVNRLPSKTVACSDSVNLMMRGPGGEPPQENGMKLWTLKCAPFALVVAIIICSLGLASTPNYDHVRPVILAHGWLNKKLALNNRGTMAIIRCRKPGTFFQQRAGVTTQDR